MPTTPEPNPPQPGTFGVGTFGSGSVWRIPPNSSRQNSRPLTAEVRLAAGEPVTAVADEVVTVDERKQLEVVLGLTLSYLDDSASGSDAESSAQVRAAADTIHIQLMAPKPSRSVIGWALKQINQLSVGFASGLAANHFPELLHAMHG